MAATALRRDFLNATQRLLHYSNGLAASFSGSAPHMRSAARLATAASDSASREEDIAQILRRRMPGAKAVRVQDTSGGCGSMYRIEVAADEFRGINVVKQHQLVAKALEEEIPRWHGFVLETKAT